MAIKKIANGKWRVQVDVGTTWKGKRDRRTKTVRSRREAEQQEREWFAERDRLRGVSSRMTLKEYVDKFWWPTKENTLQQTSLDSYEQDLRLRILPHFANVEFAKIDRLAVQQMINDCGTASTAKRARDLLRAIINDAIDSGAAVSNPAAGRFVFPRQQPKDEDAGGVWLTTFAEHRTLLMAAQGAGEVEKIILIGLCFGLRKEETLGLDVRDLDFNADALHVRRAYVKSSAGNLEKVTKTQLSERVLPMSEYAKTRLQILVADLSPDSPVCLSRSGERLSPSTATKKLRRWLEANGQPMVTMQTLRHSFASACIDAGVDIAKVSAWLGHTNITTTLNRYVKTRKKDLGAAVAAMDAVMAP